ncbi:MAG: methyltransferase regulatory domain-containing protein [Caldilineaceae bacterium]
MTSYDRIPYGGWSYAFTHPDNLATIARLYGLPVAPVSSCRVLEIGCAAGYNLIPLAFSLPDAQMVGIDLSARQIAEGRQIVDQVGVGNVELHQMDLTEWDGSLGSFDFVIAHGIYSWVEPAVRDSLLALCHSVLNPNGVAYVSYNTYPGWHMLESMRRMMLYHIREIEEPAARAAAAKELMGFLMNATENASYRLSSFPAAYEHLLHGYVNGILAMPDRTDALFLHDELEEVNDPCYFHEFLTHAAKHDLVYVADAELSTGMTDSLSEEVARDLAETVPANGETGQYLDFVVNRTFRRSLLCRQPLRPAKSIDPGVLDELCFAARAKGLLAPGTDPEAASVEFVAGDGAKLTTDHPVTIVAFTHLKAVWPARCTLAELQNAAYSQLIENNPHLRADLYAALTGADPERQAEDKRLLAENLLKAYCTSGELVSFHLHPGSFSTGIAPRPAASRWAVWEATQRETVTDLRLRRVKLSPRPRSLLPLLDGSHTLDDLVGLIEGDEELKELWSAPIVPADGPPVQIAVGDLRGQIVLALEELAGSALLS